MNASDVPTTELLPEKAAFYRRVMQVLQERAIPFLVGGGYAFTAYTDIIRHTEDFDLFIRESDLKRVLHRMDQTGYRAVIKFPHWLAKVTEGDFTVDLIFRSGNGVSEVDDEWFNRAPLGTVLGVDVQLCPPEEILWTKAFIMERERYDGADVAHLLRCCGLGLNWDRLLYLFGEDWRVLMSHLVLFGFIYPSECALIPHDVMAMLADRLQREVHAPVSDERVCRGTLLSRAQFLVDIERWGYKDARVGRGLMTEEEVEDWTDAVDHKLRTQ